MGCGHSVSTEAKQSPTSRVPTTKAPIKLFYLPGNVKITLTKLVSAGVMSSEATTTSAGNFNLNARFIDIPNQRSVRKFWTKEITSKTVDCAMFIYLADIREKPTMLLNIKTLNWLLKQIDQKGQLYIVIICSNELELSEFKSHISAPDLDLIVIKDSDPETVIQFTEVVTGEIIKFNERKRKYNEASPRTR
ncbi:hypothetical protein TVAG_495660 [Trichomonas vaginalis G3]|uniref:Uncharacterized protein n=1 Tax=Trichomonas vaginalis (strain ATCC PRA-98 / G3) TaxID=412133 RepID=A2DVK8_TRIV3|nr:hypothetical protein TVAGG3_0275730 [Trichomonas vaginalis G3]EAY15550.1 hypothetical protein TVAG_495660 [Trichomonas vaginalis G3]KAI5526196.1 hypothetical protein TVAGG3_0275730 [Trichomonas vaginalis G3]|eukprot:XP_001327773.1 hypothetical protein [Trichomonas vaginalis G3]